MKKLIYLLPIVALAVASCKKDTDCECTTLHYDDNGYYLNSSQQEYPVKNQAECDAYKVNTAKEVTNCNLDTE